MAEHWFTLGSVVGVGLGAAAGLGMLRSPRWAFGLALLAALVQVIFWTGLLTQAAVERAGGQDWNSASAASFVTSLIVVLPFTAIGAVVGATAAGLIQRIATRNTAATPSQWSGNYPLWR